MTSRGMSLAIAFPHGSNGGGFLAVLGAEGGMSARTRRQGVDLDEDTSPDREDTDRTAATSLTKDTLHTLGEAQRITQDGIRPQGSVILMTDLL